MGCSSATNVGIATVTEVVVEAIASPYISGLRAEQKSKGRIQASILIIKLLMFFEVYFVCIRVSASVYVCVRT